MLTLTPKPESFDGTVSFPISSSAVETEDYVHKGHKALKPRGSPTLSLATIDEEEIYGEFLGYGMFWSSYGVGGNQTLPKEAEFDIMKVGVCKQAM